MRVHGCGIDNLASIQTRDPAAKTQTSNLEFNPSHPHHF
jgi:hypothetical protein